MKGDGVKALKIITITYVLILSTIFTANSSYAQQYQITDLGTLGGFFSYAYGINNSGQVVGFSDSYSGSPNQAFIWDSVSGMSYLGSIDGGASEAFDINDSGQVVGSSDSGQYAFIWDSGSHMQSIGNLGSTCCSIAWGINNLGQVVGESYDGSTNRAFLWDSVSGMQPLSTPNDGSWSRANAINNSGQIAGEDWNSGTQAFMWDNGNPQSIGLTDSFAFDINDNGQITGSIKTGSGFNDHLAYTWDSSGGVQYLGTLSGTFSEAFGINSSGQIVGRSDYNAFIWESGTGMIDLNNLIPESSGWHLEYANDINDLGQIVGYGSSPSGETHAFLLTPEPVRIAGSMPVYYSTLQKAYDDASYGDIIQSRGIGFNGDFLIDDISDKTVLLEFGYNSNFSSITGKTSINGNMTVSNGTLIIENGLLEIS
jgi:probable HAF family extracellular repeat protein